MHKEIHFTKKELTELPVPPAGKRKDYYDTEVRGLMIQITSTGFKTFYLRRKVEGNSLRVAIGPFPEFTVEQARKRAMEISTSFAHGQNPHSVIQTKRTERTLGELFEAYLEGHARVRCAAAKEMEAVYRRYLKDWFGRKLSSIKRAEVQARHNEIGREHGQVPANHTLTYARAAINWCLKNELTTMPNPWIALEKFATQPRERFIRPDEFKKFMDALNNLQSKEVRDYVYLSLFTGARKSNVLAMKWEDIDLTLGIWRTLTKNGSYQTIPLTTNALSILNERKGNDAKWVFPGDGRTGHLVEPKTSWNSLLKAAEIEDLHLHDLRRTLGSYMAMGNQSLHIIGKALGHRSSTATQIYSQLAHSPVRDAMERAQADMFVAAGLVESAGESA
jgi:integrase